MTMEIIMEILGAIASVYTLIAPLGAAAKWLLTRLKMDMGWRIVRKDRLRQLEHVERTLKQLLAEMPQASDDTGATQKRKGGKWL
jgi:hypothetical protein